jgi:hypothetical protein
VHIRYDGPSHLLDVGDGQVIPRGGTGEVDEQLAKELDESSYADISIADAKGKFPELAEPLPPVAAEPAEPTAAELAADMPVLGDDAEPLPPVAAEPAEPTAAELAADMPVLGDDAEPTNDTNKED